MATFVLIAVGNPPILCVVGSHLLIHLREAADRRAGAEIGRLPEAQSVSTMRYNQVWGTNSSGKEEH